MATANAENSLWDSYESDQEFKSWFDGLMKKKKKKKTPERPALKREVLTATQREESAEKNYECSICGLNFPFKSLVEVHMARHCNRNPHKCQHCSKTFKWRLTVKQHLQVCVKRAEASSSGEVRKAENAFEMGNKASFKCSTCFKTLPSAEGLRRHLRTHTGAKPTRHTK